MYDVPEPKNWDHLTKEPFSEYRRRWPQRYAHIPDPVIETWVYKEWSEFRKWLPLEPMEWHYEPVVFNSADVLDIGYVPQMLSTMQFWGDDLLDGASRKKTWLGAYMLEHGTTPAPVIVAKGAGRVPHPREQGQMMVEPYQLIEGHMRTSYLQALIKRGYASVKSKHEVIVATIPTRFELP